jgi:predicted glutamine amidotransferase
MCRWLAYSGNPIQLETVLFNSLVDQSLHSRMGQTTTNGDGFGIGWYGQSTDIPFRYRCVHPAWSDRNLREAARAVRAPLFVAHIRAATDTPAQETNCHPFRYGRWLFAHNGLLRSYPAVRRELMMMVDPDLFPSIEGSTDSEVMFFSRVDVRTRTGTTFCSGTDGGRRRRCGAPQWCRTASEYDRVRD